MTNVLIDGMDATDPVFGYSPAGASGFFLGLNELAEVRVLTQTFNAEYGGHGGAVIEMINQVRQLTNFTDLCGNCIGMRHSTLRTTSIWAPVRSRHSSAISSVLESEGR